MLRLAFFLFCSIFLVLNTLLANDTLQYANNEHLYFIENKSQWASNILFQASFNLGTLFIEPNNLTYLLTNPNDLTKVGECKHNPACKLLELPIACHSIKVHFKNSKSCKIIPTCVSSTYSNYFLGNNPLSWASKAAWYQQIEYQSLYANIDMRYYSNNKNLKYDFIVHPKGKASEIQLLFEGADSLSLVNNNLNIYTSITTITEKSPYCYQYINGQEKAVACDFVLKNKTLSFNFPNGYDTNKDLIIDPTLVFSTYSGSSADNWGFTATYDDEGHLYAGGAAFSSGYPTTTGAFNTTFGGGAGALPTDIAITKFTPNGNNLIYSTYIGGNRNELPHSLIINNLGELLIFGTTGSTNFPTSASAYDKTFNGGNNTTLSSNIEFPQGSDIIVCKLNNDGSQLLASTYIGGSGNDGLNRSDFVLRHSYADDSRGEVIIDDNNNVYIASCTNSLNFPTSANALQNNLDDAQDACVFKLNNDLSSLIWATYLGGNADDAAYSLKLAQNGTLYVTGGTASTNFTTTNGTLNPTYKGNIDGFLSHINSNGSVLLASTYIGTNGYDQSFFIEIDKFDDVYVVGQTSGNYNVTNGVYSNTNGRQFIHCLSPNLNTTKFSTVFGSTNGTPNITPTAFLVDVCRNIYVSGWGGAVNGGNSDTHGLPITPDAYKSTTDGSDFYFIVLGPNAQNLIYGSYFGGVGLDEHVDGGTSRFDKQGIIYQAVCAGCGGSDAFPTTPNAWSNNNGSFNCNLAAIKFAFQLAGLIAAANVLPEASGCLPFSVQFQNNTVGGISPNYTWNFGDGSSSSEFEPTHTYTQIGTFNVMMIANDPNTCNIADTAYTTVTVSEPQQIQANFNYQLPTKCELKVKFNASPGGLEYKWFFGDGSTSTLINPSHIYDNEGTYTVKLIVKGNCIIPDTIQKTFILDILPPVNAGMLPLQNSCIPLSINAQSTTQNANNYLWLFGDGTSAQGATAQHTYTTSGSFNVQHIVFDSMSCNLTDTISKVVQAFEYATAAFTPSTPIIEVGQAISFQNNSTGADSYWWQFGDGNTSTEENPSHTFTQVGNPTVCLTAQTLNNCNDSICLPITIIPPINVGLPSGFTPNGDNNNDVFMVKGTSGIASMELKIYNRWGELIFETNNPNKGWDGTYKGVLQEIEVYVYTFEAILISGRSVFLKGNITLLN